MAIIYGVEALTSSPGCQNCETKISYWAKRKDAEKICKYVLGIFKKLGNSGINVIVVELNVRVTTIDGVTKFEKEDPYTKCTTYPEIRESVQTRDKENARDCVEAFLGAIAHLRRV